MTTDSIIDFSEYLEKIRIKNSLKYIRLDGSDYLPAKFDNTENVEITIGPLFGGINEKRSCRG